MAQGIGYKDSDGSYGFRMTEDGKVILGNSSDDLIQVTGTLDVSGSIYATDSIYVDVIRRHEDSSTTTKIRLMDEQVRIHAGNVNDEVLKIESGAVTIAGDLLVNQYIKHNGDENTWINFTDNRIRLNAGGNNFIDCEDPGSAPHKVRINNGGNNIDFVIKDNSGNVYFTADASTSRVGINQATPSATLDVGGTIAATTLDISGDVDIDGTLEADTITVMEVH